MAADGQHTHSPPGKAVFEVCFLSSLQKLRQRRAGHFGLTCLCVSSQDLLQLQYEGVAVMKLFDRATVNVNLLIFLLNKKFYGK